MKVQITRTYTATSIVEIKDARDLLHLEGQIGLACSKQADAVIAAIRKLPEVKEAYGTHDIKKEIID